MKYVRMAAPPRKKKEVLIFAAVLYPLYILIFAYMIYSAHLAGVRGFWNLFWIGYIEMFFINMGDFWGLDYWYRSTLSCGRFSSVRSQDFLLRDSVPGSTFNNMLMRI